MLVFVMIAGTGANGRLSLAQPPTVGGLAGHETPRILNGRSDTNLTATYGTCFEEEFRHFTLLDAPRWDGSRWAACGNLYAGKLDKVWSKGEPEYSQTLHLTIDGQLVGSNALRGRAGTRDPTA